MFKAVDLVLTQQPLHFSSNQINEWTAFCCCEDQGKRTYNRYFTVLLINRMLCLHRKILNYDVRRSRLPFTERNGTIWR